VLKCIQYIWLAVAIGLFPNVSMAQNFGNINFDFDSDRLDATTRQQIAEIAIQIQETNSYKRSVVVGYTDAMGTSGYNYELGLRRARVVADELVAAGVPVDRIGTIQSRGKTELLVSVRVPERKNRRVTVGLQEILGACTSYRNISLSQSAIGTELQGDLLAKLQQAVSVHAQYSQNGRNAPALQMAGAAQEDCGIAVGFDDNSVRKLEYAKKCFCNSARLQTALGASTSG
jgi:OmpA family protein